MDIYNTFNSTKTQISIYNYLENSTNEENINEILEGLFAEHKYISSKYFYDKAGSKLFEEITHLQEYYPTLTEKAILRNIAPQIAKTLQNVDIIELGSGDCSKISILLEAVPPENLGSIRYIPVDVSDSAILKSSKMLIEKFPDITINGLVADFLSHLNVIPNDTKRLFCFFGSTLGNLTRKQSVRFLFDLKKCMHHGDQLLLGLDMVKDIAVVGNAYNDKLGITAAFNKNILNVINRIAHTDFEAESFEHMAFYNEDECRIEMHLKALKNMEVYCPHSDKNIILKKGETIHTENSHKYTDSYILNFAALSGLTINNIYSDANKWFSIVHFSY